MAAAGRKQLFGFRPQQAGSDFFGFGSSRPKATFLVLSAAGGKQLFGFRPQQAKSDLFGFGSSRPKAVFCFGRSSPEATFLALAAAFHFLVLAAAGQIQLFWFCPQLFGCSRPEEAFLVFGRSRLDATILVGARAGRSQT